MLDELAAGGSGGEKMICVECGRDINAIGQDNVSCVPGYPLCEDCAGIKEVYDEEEE